MPDLPTGEQLREELMAEMKANGWRVWHDRSRGVNDPGLPDILGWHRRLGHWCIECKSRREHLRTDQVDFGADLHLTPGTKYRLLRPQTAAAVAAEMGLLDLASRWREQMAEAGLAQTAARCDPPTRAREVVRRPETVDPETWAAAVAMGPRAVAALVADEARRTVPHGGE